MLISIDGIVKLTDFGLAEHYTNDTDRSSWYSTPLIPKDERQDIFSTGAILYKMPTGDVPSILTEISVIQRNDILRVPALILRRVGLLGRCLLTRLLAGIGLFRDAP